MDRKENHYHFHCCIAALLKDVESQFCVEWRWCTSWLKALITMVSKTYEGFVLFFWANGRTSASKEESNRFQRAAASYDCYFVHFFWKLNDRENKREKNRSSYCIRMCHNNISSFALEENEAFLVKFMCCTKKEGFFKRAFTCSSSV